MNKRLVLSLTVASLVLGSVFASTSAIAQTENSAPVVDEAAPTAAPAEKAAHGKKHKAKKAKKAKHKAKKHHAKKHVEAPKAN